MYNEQVWWWLAIGAGIGYLIAGLQGAFLGAPIGAGVFLAARWWMYHYGPDTAFTGPVEPS